MSTFISYELPVKLLTETAKLPDKANLFDAGLDLYCDEKEVVTLAPGQRKLFSTGISVALSSLQNSFAFIGNNRLAV